MKKKYYLYYTSVHSLKFVPNNEFKEPLKIIYNKNNTVIFCVPKDDPNNNQFIKKEVGEAEDFDLEDYINV